MPMGRSSGSKRISSNRCSRPRATPTAEMNSDTTTSAPKRRHSSRNGDSDTPDMGARNSGNACPVRYGKSMAHNVMTRCATSNHSLRFAAVDFNAIDGKPVHYFFLIVAPPLEVSNQYLPVLGKIAQFAKEADVPDKLAKIGTPQEFLKLLEDKNI